MKKGFIFIETIIVVTILTVALMSIYANYSKIISNTKELNTFDTTEYNYKTYFLKQKYENGTLRDKNNLNILNAQKNKCYDVKTIFSDSIGSNDKKVKVCILENIVSSTTLEEYIDTHKSKFDAYIIDYLLSQDLTPEKDNLFLVEYKKLDLVTFYETNEKQQLLTYISSLNL